MQKKVSNFNGSIERRRVPVVRLLVDVCSYESATTRVAELAVTGNGGYVCCATVHMTMEAFDDEVFREIVNTASMVTPDGVPLVWMQRLQGSKDAVQVRGPSLMPKVLEFAAENGLTVGFHGGSEDVLKQVRKRAKEDNPKLTIGYSHSPPFREITNEEDAEMTRKLNASGTKILFVGLGCPKQERWMASHRNQTQAVMIGVGAAFAFYADNVAESPKWLRKFGLEWLFRLASEPKRLWRRYLILNPRFLWHAFRQLTTPKKAD
ncbi:MAG: WecB/TagA/CpsF family glycosyltransferase [Pyrinomonadaceae bacterium]